MHENLKTNVREKQSATDRICEIFDEIGWLYEREGNRVQVTFKTGVDSRADLIICVADILSDKIYISSSAGVKAKNEVEMLKLLNFINTNKIYFGRFVLTSESSIWYDNTVDINPSKITKEQCYRAFSIADNCCEHFCNCIADVAFGTKTAYEAIESIR